MKHLLLKTLSPLLVISLGSFACSSQSEAPQKEEVPIIRPYDVRILHINDHHSHLEPNSGKLKMKDQSYLVKTGGFPQLVSAFKQLNSSDASTIKLHAGDAITGSIYYTLFKGESDTEQMNHICFDAFAVGNHEFDNGDKSLKEFIDQLHSHPTCKTPVLSANVVFKVGVSPLAKKTQHDYIKPYIIKTINGQKIAIIGLTTSLKTKSSSRPDDSTYFVDEAKVTQQIIDQLASKESITRIIVLSHYGYENDIEMAKKLKGVDVIVGGDSHTMLGEKLSDYGFNPEGKYPAFVKNADKKDVCIVQASEYTNILGELNVWFDKNGDIESCQGKPHLVLNNSFEKEVDGKKQPVQQEELDKILLEVKASNQSLLLVDADKEAQESLNKYKNRLDKLVKQVIGKSKDLLCLERVPAQGKSKVKECKEQTKKHGSDVTTWVAKAYLDSSLKSDFAIINGGGVRTDLAKGDLTIEDVYTLLPFSNVLVEATLTGKQIHDLIEETLIYSIKSDGAYPYASGIRWHADLTKDKGSVISKLEINPRLKGKWQEIDNNKLYTVVTSDYLAQGKDGYTLFNQANVTKNMVGTDYALAFIDYVKKMTSHKKELSKLPESEYSTQALIK